MNVAPIIYIFIGPPGSGKGTLAQECVGRYGWANLSTGALCRQHISENTDIGKQIDPIIKSGKLIPDELVTSMVDSWLSRQLALSSGVILDGYPRTKHQVSMLLDVLRSKYAESDIRVVKFDIADEIVVQRLSSRLMCQNKDCQRVYSVLPEAKLAPIREGICDSCASSLVQRADDKPEVIKDRLKIFHDSDPSCFFLEKGLSVRVIDASKPFEIIVDDFEQLVKCECA